MGALEKGIIGWKKRIIYLGLLVIVFGATLFHFQFQTNLTQTNLPQTNLIAEVDQPNVTQDNEGQIELAGTALINSACTFIHSIRAVG